MTEMSGRALGVHARERDKRASKQRCHASLAWGGMNTEHPTANLHVIELAVAAIEKLAPIVATVKAHDRDLADQIRRSATSVALNAAEGLGSSGGTRRARLETARGSAKETRVALRVACAWGYLDRDRVRDADADLDRVGAMLWRLSRG